MKDSILKKGTRYLVKKRFKFLSDKRYLEIMYRVEMGKKLDLKNPQTFNEKLQWLKLYDRKPEYTTMVDKYAAKQWVADRIGEQYIIPTLGVWDKFDDIDFDKLPDQFVLKCTHDSGGLVIVKDKSNFDKEAARKKIEKSLKRNYYWIGREWPYKNVKPRIIAEQYMEDDCDGELKDYKILCFNGRPDNIMVCTGRFRSGVKYYFFDFDWNFLRYNKGDNELPADFSLRKPDNLDKMLEVSKILSKCFNLIRIDLYETHGKVWFGEMTFYPDSGFDTDITYQTDLMFGNKLSLPYWDQVKKN